VTWTGGTDNADSVFDHGVVTSAELVEEIPSMNRECRESWLQVRMDDERQSMVPVVFASPRTECWRFEPPDSIE